VHDAVEQQQRISPDMAAAEQLAELAAALISADVSVTWLLRLARAAVDEPTAARHRADWLAIEDLLRRTIAVAAPGLDDRAAAVELLALLDGLACSVAVEPDRVSGAYAESIARSHVAHLLTQSRETVSG
jgi:hypothetical protein